MVRDFPTLDPGFAVVQFRRQEKYRLLRHYKLSMKCPQHCDPRCLDKLLWIRRYHNQQLCQVRLGPAVTC